MNAEAIFWVLIIAGFIPWWVSRRMTETRVRGRRRTNVEWRVQAIFWRLTVRRPGRAAILAIELPLIRRLADASGPRCGSWCSNAWGRVALGLPQPAPYRLTGDPMRWITR